MSKLKVKKVIIFKHGVSYFILEGTQKGTGTFELEFKIDEMNDVLKSLFVLDTSENGYISSISYDAALDTYQLLKSVMLDIPDSDSFSSLITQIKGAKVNLIIGTSDRLTGTIMGIEYVEKLNREGKITEKLLTLLKDDDIIIKIPFSEISSFEILNEDLKKDLKFFLDTIIAGKKKDAKKIIINCESGREDAAERKIVVSYIRESPIWKTTYRILMSRQQALENKCLLAGYCMVENTTNDDWEDIILSLVAGMPVSFVYNFYRPIYIDRPQIQPPRVLSARPIEIEEGLREEDYRKYKKEAEKKPALPKAARQMARAGIPPPAPGGRPASGALAFGTSVMADMDESTIMDKLQAQTAVKTKDLGELFEYNISNPVSIKRKHSALVPILTEETKAKKILLYNKSQHDKNPDACLEITNNTSLTLERGPVTIIYDDNLAGEAIIPFLNKDDTRILNYAVEQAVIINAEEKISNRNVHRISIGGGYFYEYYFSDRKTKYKIKNKTDEEKELYIDHPKISGYKVKESPVEPEDTPNYNRFKLKLKSKEAIEFNVSEQNELSRSIYIYNYNKDALIQKIQFYLKHNWISEQLEGQLTELSEIIGRKAEIVEKKTELENESYQMTEEQSRLRENIKVLGNSTQESKLREKYVNKLSEQEERFEAINREIKRFEEEIKVLDKEIDKKIKRIKL